MDAARAIDAQRDMLPAWRHVPGPSGGDADLLRVNEMAARPRLRG